MGALSPSKSTAVLYRDRTCRVRSHDSPAASDALAVRPVRRDLGGGIAKAVARPASHLPSVPSRLVALPQVQSAETLSSARRVWAPGGFPFSPADGPARLRIPRPLRNVARRPNASSRTASLLAECSYLVWGEWRCQQPSLNLRKKTGGASRVLLSLTNLDLGLNSPGIDYLCIFVAHG